MGMHTGSYIDISLQFLLNTNRWLFDGIFFLLFWLAAEDF